MASNIQITEDLAEALAAVISTMLDGGVLRIYDGAQPASADDAVTTQNLLAEFDLPNPFESSAADGVITADTIAPTLGLAAGMATWFRVLTTGGAAVVYDGSVGTSDADCIVISTSISIGQEVEIISMLVIMPTEDD